MKLKIRLFALTLSLLTLFALTNKPSEAASGLQREGCWSPYPNCSWSRDVFFDENGNKYLCGSCDGIADNCYKVDPNLITQYWCD